MAPPQCSLTLPDPPHHDGQHQALASGQWCQLVWPLMNDSCVSMLRQRAASLSPTPSNLFQYQQQASMVADSAYFLLSTADLPQEQGLFDSVSFIPNRLP